MILRSCVIWLLAGALLMPAATWAQERNPGALPRPLKLEEAVNYALTHHPRLAAQSAIEDSAAGALDAARAQFLPRADIILQENRATGNVVPGSHFSQFGIPAVSGPPTGRVFGSGVWGSTAGLGLSWDIAHLSEQMHLADAALAERRGAGAGVEAQKLAVAFGAADAFALAVEARERVKAAQSSVERAEVFESTVDARARSGLRPGADAARAAAEVAAVRTRLIREEAAQAISEAQLAEALGAAGQRITVVPGRLLESALSEGAKTDASPQNPLVIAADEARRSAEQRKRAALLEYIPRVDIAAALWGRGNGLFPGGANLGFAQGVVPDTPNWAAGVVVTIPILQIPEIRARADIATANERLAAARRDEVFQQIETQIDSARIILTSAFDIAKEARISLDSSRAAADQAQARYRAGLYTVDPVAEALRLLAQADSDNSVAQIEVWRAKLLVARAIGAVGPLLNEISEAGARGH